MTAELDVCSAIEFHHLRHVDAEARACAGLECCNQCVHELVAGDTRVGRTAVFDVQVEVARPSLAQELIAVTLMWGLSLVPLPEVTQRL